MVRVFILGDDKYIRQTSSYTSQEVILGGCVWDFEYGGVFDRQHIDWRAVTGNDVGFRALVTIGCGLITMVLM